MKRYLLLLITVLALSASGQNNPPVAVNDTVRPVIGTSFNVNVLKNDYDPDGDSLIVMNLDPFRLNDSTWRFTPDKINLPDHYDSISRKFYYLKDEHGAFSKAAFIIIIWQCTPRYDSLDINNIKALISPYGNHFWDGKKARFEAPKGSGKTPIFNHTLWIGGMNDTGQLCLAGEYFREQGIDFFSGPASSFHDSTFPMKWNRVWKLNKTQIDEHRSNWSNAGYTPIEAIANWPAHGYVHFGQTANIAPFKDTDQDGVYNPLEGDYPFIRGDQAVFFVMNDSKSRHTESYGVQVGIEVHGMAYAFDRPEDSALNNMIFIHYDILNRSQNTYTDTYLGLFCYMHLGSDIDDYLGCDVTQGLYYVYNADPVDGNGEPDAYGEHPPAFGLKLIGGPFLEPDGEDNPSGNCDEGLNGLNFGDRIPDNERRGLDVFTRVLTHFSLNLEVNYYGFMRGYRHTGNPFMFGDKVKSTPSYGGAFHFHDEGEGPACRYFYPGDSDTLCNYGTGGLPPLGGYNQNGLFWTDSTCGNTPGGRLGVGSVGPFTLHPGETVPLDYCFLWARDYHGDHHSSVDLLRERIAGLKPFWNTLIQLPSTYYGIAENRSEITVTVFPNPVKSATQVILNRNKACPYYLYHVNGIRVSEGVMKPGDNVLDLSHLPPGIYLLTCDGITVKVVKI